MNINITLSLCDSQDYCLSTRSHVVWLLFSYTQVIACKLSESLPRWLATARYAAMQGV